MTQSDDPAVVDEQMLELAGVQYLGHDLLDFGYFDLQPPLLTRGAFANVRPTGDSSVLVHRRRPMAAGDGGRSFGHGFAPPADRDDRPAVVAGRCGRGEVVYVAAPVLRSYLDYQSPQLAGLLLSLVDRLLPNHVARIWTPAQVEMTAMRREGDLLVHLVNHSGNERPGNYWYPVTEYIPEIRDIQVAIRSERPLVVLRVPQRADVACELADGYLRFRLPALHIMESFLVPGYFADSARPGTE